MQLQVKPNSTNDFPLEAILIKGANLFDWLREIQCLDISVEKNLCYPLPGVAANTVWGCLVVLKQKVSQDIGKHVFFQKAEDNIFIPAFTQLYPKMNKEELLPLFAGNKVMFHPEIGWVVLEEAMDWQELLSATQQSTMQLVAPKESNFVPQQIRRFEILALPPEEALEQMIEDSFPKNETFKDEPLNAAEKAKLNLLRKLFNKNKNAFGEPRQRSGLMSLLDKFTRMFSGKPANWTDKLEQDYEGLEKRNQDEMQKLMDLFRTNPEEALKYAIPLDNDGTTRGGTYGAFSMQRRWNNFSWNQSSSFGSGSNFMANDSFARLSEQYHKTAKELIKKGDYEKAAFVYLKLLKNPITAASTLEQGKLYAEAAAIHLKYNNNKHAAAQCYVKGNMLSQAIELYRELSEFEKVGDLYMQLSQQAEAYRHYEIVIDDYKQSGKYAQAALLYRNKMNDRNSAQDLLRTGWRLNRDSFNCLNQYFNNIEDVGKLRNEIETIYETEVNKPNKEVFLQVLQYEFEKHPELRERTKELAYEIVAEIAEENTGVVSSLQHFNKDKMLIKDILRFKNDVIKR